MITSLFFALSLGGAISVGPTEARYALVVGSNEPGRGQERLRFAEDDARKFSEVLRELGGYPSDHVWTLVAPSKRTLQGSLASLALKLAKHRDSGEQASVVFYYSGHARAAGLSFANEEVSFAELRDALALLPATFKLVLLDACQSGEFSRVKGIEPASDFSHNALGRLQVEGFAVMASSTGTELSQESDKLGGSYFTHHLLVALRGAGDADHDGRVTLDESYRYAYAQTLYDTSSTKVGEQHVTLETDLKGKGEVALTYPAKATAILSLHENLVGVVFVQREPSRSVIAELYKVHGEPIALALPAGEYTVTLREQTRSLRCSITLQDGANIALQTHACTVFIQPSERTKAASAPSEDQAFIRYEGLPPLSMKRRPAPPRFAHWELRLGIGGQRSLSDGYNRDLSTFAFEDEAQNKRDVYGRFRVQGSVAYHVNRYFAAVIFGQTLDSGGYQRFVTGGGSQKFSWSAGGIGAAARAQLWLFDDYFNPYLQFGAGLGIGKTTYQDHDSGVSESLQNTATTQMHYGVLVQGAVGVNIVLHRNIGLYAQLDYTYAPIIKNLLARTHDSGGFAGSVGVRIGL